MKVIVPLNFDDEERKMIAWDQDGKGKATRKMIRDWVFNAVSNRIMNIYDRQDDESRNDRITRY